MFTYTCMRPNLMLRYKLSVYNREMWFTHCPCKGTWWNWKCKTLAVHASPSPLVEHEWTFSWKKQGYYCRMFWSRNVFGWWYSSTPCLCTAYMQVCLWQCCALMKLVTFIKILSGCLTSHWTIICTSDYKFLVIKGTSSLTLTDAATPTLISICAMNAD